MKRMKIKSCIFLVFMVLTIIAVGCAPKDAEKSAEGSKEKPLEKVSVVLDWYPNAIHSFLYVAQEKGYFAEEGIELEILFPANPNDAISLPAAGRADIGLYYLQDVALARGNEEVPVQSIGAVVQSPLSIVLSLKEKNITSPKDLIGKKIGYGGSALVEELIATMITYAGEEVSSVDAIDVGFDLMSSMTTGKVDATIGCLINHEVPAMEKEGFEVNYFFPTDYGVPNYYELVMVAGEDTIQKRQVALKGFLRACKKGFDDMKANPEEALQILLEHQNADDFPLIEDVEQKSIETLLPVMETEDAAFLTQTEQVWQENIDWLADTGLLRQGSFPASEIVRNLME